ncbi:MAG TPA: type II toxin-antitoxin system Phd/YefM family antitoxin [Rhodanobacteraceae bacterium]|nr:type II toxin-antitoxin system Phd/YefM family antitoxin [Rhodanobacteraceae bacterium]
MVAASVMRSHHGITLPDPAHYLHAAAMTMPDVGRRLLIARLEAGPLKDYIRSCRSGHENPMRHASQIRPISYLKANAAEVLRQLGEQRVPMVITQNGEAKAVLQDVASYDEAQETLALLKILALGNREIEQGQITPVAAAVDRLRAKTAGA